MREGETAPLKPQHKGSKATTGNIEEQHKFYLHELYGYAISTTRVKATFKKITESMNEKLQSPAEARPELSLHYKQVYSWWKANGGVEKSPFEKPRLAEEHKKNRVIWIKKWGPKFLDAEFLVCYLDERCSTLPHIDVS